MIFKNIVVPESKEMLKQTNKNHNNEGYLKRTQEPIERDPNDQSWNNLKNEINKVVYTYISQLKANISSHIYKSMI